MTMRKLPLCTKWLPFFCFVYLLTDSFFLYGQAWLGGVEVIGKHSDANSNEYLYGCSGSQPSHYMGLTIIPQDRQLGDWFIAKRNPAGNWEWLVQFPMHNQARLLSCLTTDAAGDVYIAGTHSNDVLQLGSFQLVDTIGACAGYIAKLSGATGQWEWAKQWQPLPNPGCLRASTVFPRKVYPAPDGGILMLAHYQGRVQFDSVYLQRPLGVQLLLSSFSATGQIRWASVSDGDTYVNPETLNTDAQGNIVVAGNYTGNARFGTHALPAEPSNNVNVTRTFVAKLGANRTWAWAVAGAPQLVARAGSGIAVTEQGNVIITGRYTSPITLGGTPLSMPYPMTVYPGATAHYVAALDSSGHWQWAITTGGNSWSEEQDVVAKSGGGFYLADTYSSTLHIGTQTLTCTGINDCYVACFSDNGLCQWALPAGVTAGNYVGGLKHSANGLELMIAFNVNSPARVGNIILGPAGTQYRCQIGLTPTGLPDQPTFTTLEVTPNPAHQTVRLTGATSATADVLDATGRVVRTAALVPGASSLDLRGLAPGLYLVRAGQQTRRLVVE